MDMLDQPKVSNYQKLKLVMLYTLRYENDPKIAILQEKLRFLNFGSVSLALRP